MAKYEIEIDDATACRLLRLPNIPEASEVIREAQFCLARYAGYPELVTPRHVAALAIVRASVASQAQISERQTHAQEADSLLNFVLEGG